MTDGNAGAALPAPKCMIVLGMHRSGTSAVSCALRIFGARHGDSLVGGLASNPLGHWEDIDVLRLNDAMLAALGMAWDSGAPVTEDGAFALERQGFAEAAAKLLADKIAANGFYALKDPRMTKLLPFWHKILSPFRPLYVIVCRNPASVAASLAKRDNLAPERSYRLWAEHMLQSFCHAREDSHFPVNYDDFMDRPGHVIRSMAQFFSLPVIEEEYALITGAFLSTALRHTKFDARHLHADPACPPGIPAMCEELEYLCRRRAKPGRFTAFYRKWREILAASLPRG